MQDALVDFGRVLGRLCAALCTMLADVDAALLLLSPPFPLQSPSLLSPPLPSLPSPVCSAPTNDRLLDLVCIVSKTWLRL